MRISFFVEFPEKELEKLALIDFPIKLYLASRSLNEFREHEKKALKLNPMVEAAYWPILEKSYWISPFSYNKELDNLHKDLSNNKKELEVLLDLELPTFWLRLFIYNIPAILANTIKYHLRIKRPRIKTLFRNQDKYKIKITTTSYPATSRYHLINYITFKILGLLGLYYNPRAYRHNVIYMCYSSIRRDVLIKTLKNLDTRKLGPSENYQIGLGLLDYGMLSKTGFILKLQKIGLLRRFVLLSPERLNIELSLVDKYSIKKVTIYCLGGLNREYVEVLKKHVKISVSSMSLSLGREGLGRGDDS
jgi:hypothetical protein